MAKIASATFSLYWLETEKRWMLVHRSEAGPARFRYVETTLPMDRELVALIAGAIEREMESFLHA